ncbi:hypothetical protein C8R47DRAFT_654827 [Mycena vitilis]|nr:hypothetical protein C8R47DRAFT_654827 [Mycena vitilis]
MSQNTHSSSTAAAFAAVSFTMNPAGYNAPTQSAAAAALALNPRPSSYIHQCGSCSSSMGQLTQCLGSSGEINPENWARWFQKCNNCPAFYWHNLPTPLEFIPQDVQMKIALVRSSKETGASLMCQEANCFTASNKPKRANRECGRFPPCCSGCCKASGGCHTQSHRLNHRDIPTSSNVVANSSTDVLPPSQDTRQPTASGPAPLHNASSSSSTVVAANGVAPLPRSYARPLKETFATGFLSRHLNVAEANSRLDAQMRAAAVTEHSVHIVVWAQTGHKPNKFELVSKLSGQLVVADHPLLVTSAVRDGFISYLESPESETWCIRDARVPISTSPGVRVLLHATDVPDNGCLGVNDEIDRLLAERSNISQKERTRKLLSLSGASPSASRQPSAEPAEPTATEPFREIAPLKFPFMWAADMKKGFSAIRAADTRGSLAAFEREFAKAFPSCNFKSKTVYKHLKVYDDAVTFDLLDQICSVGRNPGGKWTDVVKAVEELQERRKSIASGKSIAPAAPIVISDDDDDSHQYNVMTMKKEGYRYTSEARIESYSPDSKETDVAIWDAQSEHGHRMRISLAHYSEPGHGGVFISIALKTLLSLVSTTLWGSTGMAVWCEGARLADCQFQFAAFQNRAGALDVDIAGVNIIPTSLFCCEDKYFVAQPWECGVAFSVNALAIDSNVHHILTAFSHFTFQTSNHRSVYVDFQGFRTVTGYKVFDSRTHVMEASDSPTHYPVLESLGRDGIQQFVDNHICGSICKALGLNALPLTF